MYQVQRKRKGFVFFTLIFLGAFAVGLGIGYATIKLHTEPRQPQPAEQIEATPTAVPTLRPASVNMLVPEETKAQTAQYFVAEQNGTVSVFTLDENGNKKFSHHLPIQVEALREADRKLFKEGIFLYSKQELLELTEDFSS